MVSRFAPAPTGYLHLGHVVNAIFVWGCTRAAGGRVLLRIEDHDRQRSRPAFERAILDDLDWLAFTPDEPTTAAFRGGACIGRQSDRAPLYESALATLRSQGLIYACACSRRDLASSEPTERPYPGTCASRRVAEGPGVGLRLRLAPGSERFLDLRHGPMEQDPAVQCGDLLVRDRAGNWTYQFAAAVDDMAQGITHVIRGDDLLTSTGRQIRLARLLGRQTPPRFLHHPLVMKSPARKLSKSDQDTGVRDLRGGGWTAAEVIGHAAHLVGLLPAARPLHASDVSAVVTAFLALRA